MIGSTVFKHSVFSSVNGDDVPQEYFVEKSPVVLITVTAAGHPSWWVLRQRWSVTGRRCDPL